MESESDFVSGGADIETEFESISSMESESDFVSGGADIEGDDEFIENKGKLVVKNTFEISIVPCDAKTIECTGRSELSKIFEIGISVIIGSADKRKL
jgi:hypothetical protein